MDKFVFKELKGRLVKLQLKPDGFGLTGIIEGIYDTCIAFRTKQKTSYINIDVIGEVIPCTSEEEEEFGF